MSDDLLATRRFKALADIRLNVVRGFHQSNILGA